MSQCCHEISHEVQCPQDATIWIGHDHTDYFEVCGDCAPIFDKSCGYFVRMADGRVISAPDLAALAGPPLALLLGVALARVGAALANRGAPAQPGALVRGGGRPCP